MVSLPQLKKHSNFQGVSFKFSHYAHIPPVPGDKLCLRNACRGTELCEIDGKKYEVGARTPLIVNINEPCLLLTKAEVPVMISVLTWSRTVVNQVFFAHCMPFEKSVDMDWNNYTGDIFFKNRIEHDSEKVNFIIREIENEAVKYPLSDSEYIEELMVILLKTIYLVQRGFQDLVGDVQSLKAPQRMEVMKRVLIGKEFIDSCFGRKITVSDVAEVAGLSQYHFIRLFNGVFKMTPRQYLIKKRFELAGNMLLDTDKEIAEIALEIGLDNPSYFIKRFKRIFSLTPGEFRKMPPGKDWKKMFLSDAE